MAWYDDLVVNMDFVVDPTVKLSGFELNRKSWKNLNRIRTNCGICNYSLYKWNKTDCFIFSLILVLKNRFKFILLRMNLALLPAMLKLSINNEK